MPCVECGASTREKYGSVVAQIVERNDDETLYICLDCMITMLKNTTDES